MAAQGTGLIDLGKGHNRYKEKLKSYDFTVTEGIVTRRSPLGAVHWARSTPTAWAIRQVRAHESLFHAADLVLKKGADLRSRAAAQDRRVNRPDRSTRRGVRLLTGRTRGVCARSGW